MTHALNGIRFALAVTPALIVLSGCASLNKKLDVVPGSRNSDYAQFEGKTPLQIRSKIGEPFSAGWHNNDMGDAKSYYTVYPISAAPLTTMDVMMNSGTNCVFFYFYAQDGFKLTESNQVDHVNINQCKLLKDQLHNKWEMDDSKVAVQN